MSIRRSIISSLLWFGVAAIFTIHIILQHRKDDHQVEEFSEKQITQVKTTILQRTELENIHQRKQKRGMGTNNGEEGEGEGEKSETIKPHNEGEPSNEHDDSNKVGTATQQQTNSSKQEPPGVENKPRGGESVVVVKEHEDGGSGMVGVQSLLDKAQEEIERLRTENKRLNERELQLKKIARQLAAKLRSKNQVAQDVFPKVDPRLPWVYGITPTYARFTQKADLTRLVQTLLHVTNFHWIVVEDSPIPTKLVTNLLRDSGLRFTHLHIGTPDIMRKAPKWKKPHRGVAQRNHALRWVRENVDAHKTQGAVYFMDDDNTYHRKIFDQMRFTRHVSIWGVGLAGAARWAGPLVKDGKVTGFHVYWAPERSFPIDMCGFAASLKLLLLEKPEVVFNAHAKLGHLEPTFLEALTTKDQLEPLANNATEILVWHTRTEVPKVSIRGEKMLIKEGRPTYPEIEV